MTPWGISEKEGAHQVLEPEREVLRLQALKRHVRWWRGLEELRCRGAGIEKNKVKRSLSLLLGDLLIWCLCCWNSIICQNIS